MTDRKRERMSNQTTSARALDLSKPLQIRAEMARQGLLFTHLLPYDDPERGTVDPLDDDETKTAVRAFMGRIWLACLRAERGDNTGIAEGITDEPKDQPNP